MTLIRCLALVLVFYTVTALATSAESDDESPQRRRLRVGEWIHRLIHHGKTGTGAKREMNGEDAGNGDEAMVDDLEERLAALHPEERFDWKGFGKHILTHASSLLEARELGEEGDGVPEELNDLSPEERGLGRCGPECRGRRCHNHRCSGRREHHHGHPRRY